MCTCIIILYAGTSWDPSTKRDEMVQIMSHLHQYVPSYEYNVSTFIPSINETVVETKAVVKTTLFGGDQLTSSRGKGALKARVNADSPSSRFDGLLPIMEDWHTKVLFFRSKLLITLIFILSVNFCYHYI